MDYKQTMKLDDFLKQIPGNFTLPLRGSLFVNAYALIVSNILVAVASYLFWILAARRFEPEVVGAASAILSAMAVLNTLTGLGLEVGLLRFIPSLSSTTDQASLISFSFIIRIVVSILSAIVFLVGLRIWSPGLSNYLDEDQEIILFISLVLTNGIYQLTNAVFVAHRTSHIVSISSGVYNGLKLVALCLLPVAIGSKGVLFTVAASLFVTIIMAGFLICGKYKNESYKVHKNPQLKEFFFYSSSNQIVEILLGLPQMLLPLFVINFLGAEQNALFYIAWMISSIVRTFSTSIAQSTFAEGSSQPENLSKNLWQGLRLSVVTTLACSALLGILAPWLLAVFGKNYASGGLAMLRLFLVSVIPFSFVILYITAQRVRKNFRYLLFITFAWFSISVLGSLAGLQMDGLAGLTAGWVLSQFIAFALAVILYLLETHTPQRLVKA